MSQSGPDYFRELDKKERKDAIELLSQQIAIEQKLVSLYDETKEEIESSAVQHILHMIQLDSQKHIAICQVVIDILNGEEVLKEEKAEILQGLRKHMELEFEAISKANKLLKNVWVRENQGLEVLVKKWRDDEREHHRALKKLTDKRFFRLDPLHFAAALRSPEELEKSYKKYFRKIYRTE
jgi:hypothetical protein